MSHRLLRASRVCQCKGANLRLTRSSAGNIEHIGKGCNAAMTDARSSRRTRRTGFLDLVALLGNMLDITGKARGAIFDCALTNQRLAALAKSPSS